MPIKHNEQNISERPHGFLELGIDINGFCGVWVVEGIGDVDAF